MDISSRIFAEKFFVFKFRFCTNTGGEGVSQIWTDVHGGRGRQNH